MGSILKRYQIAIVAAVLFALALTFAFVLCFSPDALAQSPPLARKAPPPPPPPPPPPTIDQEQFLPYWTTESGWQSELQLRNNLPAGNLTVTPVLRAPDGTETVLSPVTIKPQEVQTVDLETAVLGSAPQNIAAHGSLVLRYHSPGAGTLFAMLFIHNTGHSVAFHIDGRGESQDLQAGTREGIWWLPNDSASDYLILVNQGRNPLPLGLSLFDANGKASTQKLILSPRATNRVSVRQLVTAAGLTGTYGGIKVSAVTHAGSLNTLHIVFDNKAGFSALMKMFDHDPMAQIKERDYAGTGIWTLRAPMLALSNPDPALAVPLGTTLQPQIFIRNTTGKPIDAALRFNWRNGSTTGKAVGPQLHLNPYETRRIDVAALQDGTVLPKQANWTSVTLTTNALPDELMAVAASYDQSLHFGAQTPFSDQLAFHWEGGIWEYDTYHDSLIAVGNGGTKPTQAALTIFYNQGMQRYDLEQTLQPDEQMWIDVGKLIQLSVPDKSGNTLPADLTSGSYQIRDLTNKAVGALFEGKVIYDKTYGHVTYGCVTCCGYTATVLSYVPLFLPVGGSAPNGVQADDQCTGGQYWEDVSSSFYGNWSTANTNIATVDHTGNHTGMAVGITSSTTWGDLQSFNMQYHCPIVQKNPQGPAQVMPQILLGGANGTNITNTTQSVVVGQQLVLYGKYTLPSGYTFTSQSWTVPGTTVGGFNTSLTSGGPASTDFSQQSTTFYWVVPASSQGVTFTLNYTDSQNQSRTTTAAATFNIAGPSNPGIATQLGQVDITPGPELQFGNLATPGIKFTASATPPSGYSNNFVWVQVNTNDALLITLNSNTTQTCNWATTPPGGDPYLDTTYPYDTHTSTSDSPAAGLDSTTYKELVRNFAATMYLMWTPNLPNAIPVPMGYLSWNWSGDAAYNSSTQLWTVAGSSQNANAFQASNSYPTWTRYSNYSTRNCN